jgi:hypothetical protein
LTKSGSFMDKIWTRFCFNRQTVAHFADVKFCAIPVQYFFLCLNHICCKMHAEANIYVSVRSSRHTLR